MRPARSAEVSPWPSWAGSSSARPGSSTPGRRGLDESLQTMAGEWWGTVLLLVVAAGFVCYGAFCVVEARHRRVD